ncbi:MAG: glycosyltransferase family 2 protein [candidate division Zixibacteria bacterium]|nr:glycosyltransferase family 2 protein [candidate division Zixibacteria bacterium]
MKKLSVVVITRNEEHNLRRCLESVSWADEIVVIDSHSTDRTVEIATGFSARVYDIDWPGFGPAKRKGVDRATGEWILSLDADEVVSDELAAEIRKVLEGDDEYSGYYMPRKANFLGRWIYHCGWYPDPLLRLFDKSRGNFNDALVHEKVLLKGRVGRLKGELRHYSYPTLDSYFSKFNRYTTLGAEAAFRQGKRAGWFDILVRPPASFLKHYIIKQGFRDGWEGFLISVLSSAAVLVKYAKLKEMTKKKNVTENE